MRLALAGVAIAVAACGPPGGSGPHAPARSAHLDPAPFPPHSMRAATTDDIDLRGGPMAQQLAGFAFGMAPGDVRRTCQGASGTAVAMEEGPNGLLGCSRAPAAFGVDGPVFVRLCSGKACEIGVLPRGRLEQREGQMLALLRMMASRYGRPTEIEGEPAGRIADTCGRSKVAVRAQWHFSRPEGPPGRIVVAYHCDRHASVDVLALIFQDARAMKRPLSEFE